jgi:hypothetical protein
LLRSLTALLACRHWARACGVRLARGPHAAMAGLLQGLVVLLALAALPAMAQPGVDLTHLTVDKQDGNLMLDFSAHVTLSRPVEDAVQRGVPLYFVAQADLFRHRWYWRDAHIATATRSWRLSYQPLSDSWRVTLGALSQTYGSLREALNALAGSAGWKIADAGQIEPDARYYVEFSYHLDTSQLPRPMQFGLGNESDWSLGVERTVRVE